MSNKTKRIFLLIGLPIAGLLLFSTLFLFLKPQTKKATLVNPVATSAASINSSVLAAMEEKNKPRIEKEINILLLGLDGRRGDKKPRCDTIHFLTYDPDEKNIIITTIPRGTRSDMQNVATASAYLGNVCHILGIEEAISRIEKIAGIQPDYMVKVGFSQVLGILRTLKLPTTPTLQFLRNRRYGIGDYQRNHNQALFIKDVIMNHTVKFFRLPETIKYLIFRMVDTNMPFDIANTFLEQIVEDKIYQEGERIILVKKPFESRYVKKINFTEEKFEDPSNWQNDEEFKIYQKNLELYLKNLITSCNKLMKTKRENQAFKKIEVPFSQQLWLQIEDEDLRNQIHFDMLKIYALTSPDKSQTTYFILDFITEMETFKQNEWKEEGEKLMELVKT